MKKLKVLGCDLDVKISPTFLQSAACPFCLKCKYIDHIENVYIRVNTLRGQAAHEAIAELTQMALDEKMPVQELSDEQVFEAAVRHTPSEIVSEQNNILKWTLLWRDRFKLSKHHFGHEERMALDDAFQECPWDEASYRGIVDILEVAGPHAIVTDYKSQARPMSQHELDNHDQLTHYCWLVDKQYGGEGRGIKRYSGRIWYLQYGFYHQTERTREDLALYEKRMHAQVQKIADISSWDPVPCDHCVVCDFVHICPIAENVSSPPKVVISQVQAEDAANRIVVLEVLLGALKKALKKYVEANDAVRINGSSLAIGFRASEKLVYDLGPLDAVLKEAGHGLVEDDLVKLNAAAMKKFLKKTCKDNEELRAKVLELAVPESTVTFRTYKLTEPTDTTSDEISEDEVD